MDRDLTDKTTNATGKAYSDTIYGAFIESRMPISKNWNIDSSITYRKIGFASSSTRTFTVESENYLRLSLGTSRTFEKFSLGAGIVYEQLPLITGVSSSNVGISSFNVLSPYILGDWNFYSWGKTTLGLEGRFLYNLSSSKDSFKLNSGMDATLGLSLTRSLSETFSYSLLPFATYGSKETNTVKHTDLNYGSRLLFNWFH